MNVKKICLFLMLFFIVISGIFSQSRNHLNYWIARNDFDGGEFFPAIPNRGVEVVRTLTGIAVDFFISREIVVNSSYPLTVYIRVEPHGIESFRPRSTSTTYRSTGWQRETFTIPHHWNIDDVTVYLTRSRFRPNDEW